MKYKHNYSLDLDCFETKRNVDEVDVYLVNIQYNMINNIYSSFKMLDQKASEDFNDIYP